MSKPLFIQGLEEALSYTYTENGALTYSTTLDANLDFFGMASAKRGNPEEAVELFVKAAHENIELSLLNLFYLRDIRGGQGERNIFRCILKTQILKPYLENKEFLKLIPEYGRWDDVISLLTQNFNNTAITSAIRDLISEQIELDSVSETPSLLAKWIPLVNNVSNYERKAAAKFIIQLLGIHEEEWRKKIVKIRKKLELVESKLTEKKYNEIEYDKVPSRAFNKYKNAFQRNDGDRFKNFLEDVQSGEKKLNAKNIYPYEIIAQVREEIQTIGPFDRISMIDRSRSRCYSDVIPRERRTLYDNMWKALPEYNMKGNVLTVVDVSGSMFTQISPKSTAKAIDVSIAFGIYTAEHNNGYFQNYYISFSAKPNLIYIDPNMNIIEKLLYIHSLPEGYDTNLQRVFKLILNTMLEKNLQPSDCPSIILIISDMEFNEVDGPQVDPYGSRYCQQCTNFEEIKNQYANSGYQMPQLVFWNVMSRRFNVPVRKNEDGVILISGLSPSILKFISEGSIDPMKFMTDVLYSERYQPILEVINTN